MTRGGREPERARVKASAKRDLQQPLPRRLPEHVTPDCAAWLGNDVLLLILGTSPDVPNRTLHHEATPLLDVHIWQVQAVPAIRGGSFSSSGLEMT